MDFQEIKYPFSRLEVMRWFIAVARSLANSFNTPAPQPSVSFTILASDAHGPANLIPFRGHILYRFRGARSDQGHFLPWDDLSQELRLLAVNHFQSIVSEIKKAGYELPKELLYAIREYHKAICKSGFLKVKIKAFFLPLKLIPQSLHPNKVACWR